MSEGNTDVVEIFQDMMLLGFQQQDGYITGIDGSTFFKLLSIYGIKKNRRLVWEKFKYMFHSFATKQNNDLTKKVKEDRIKAKMKNG